MPTDIALRAVGADDEASLRELVFARLVALGEQACACDRAHARARWRDFELCMRSIASDPQLTDLHERLLPVYERVAAHRAQADQ